MPFVFFAVMIAAVVGIFRPYKFMSRGKRWHYVTAAIASFFAIGITAPPSGPVKSKEAAIAAPAETGGTAASVVNAEMPRAEPSNWQYETAKDEMRGRARRTAVVQSDNTVRFGFPYGEQPAHITVRQDPQYGFDVMFSLPSGQILCQSYDDSYVNVKFDGGPIQRFGCTDASDGSSDVAFLTNPKGFLAKIKYAKRTVIEAEFYEHGRQQYIFNTANLNWE